MARMLAYDSICTSVIHLTIQYNVYVVYSTFKVVFFKKSPRTVVSLCIMYVEHVSHIWLI